MHRVEINGRIYTLTTQELQRARLAGCRVAFILGEV